MSGKPGQQGKKPREAVRGVFVAGFLKGYDRRYRTPQAMGRELAGLTERCGGDAALDPEERTQLEFYVYMTRIVRLAAQAGVAQAVDAEAAYRRARKEAKGTSTLPPRRPKPRRSSVPESVVNDSVRTWLGLDRRVELLKNRNRLGGQDLAKAIQFELQEDET